MSTPLELAQAIVSDRFSEFGAVKKIAQALIEAEKQREPVEIRRVGEWPFLLSAPCPKCCTRCEWHNNFCHGCAVPLKWTKEKA